MVTAVIRKQQQQIINGDCKENNIRKEEKSTNMRVSEWQTAAVIVYILPS